MENNDTKQLYSMTNSTTTGTSDISTSSIRHGGSTYTFSTSSNKTVGLVGLNNIGNTCFMYFINIIKEFNFAVHV